MEKMTVKVVGLTTTKEEEIKNITKTDYLLDGGHSANICYTQKSYDEILKEPEEKTLKRALGNISNKHHSVFGHDNILLYFEGIPKIIAMFINNENEYNTSEKSGRYTVMYGNFEENELYNKWKERFNTLIKEVYPNEPYLTDKMINKKALENARYLLSIFMRTKMKYTTSFTQLNYLYGFAERFIEEETTNPLKIAIKPYMEEFRDTLKSTNFIAPGLVDYRERNFSLIEDFNSYDEQFGRAYSVNYEASIPAIADIQRHRSLDYSISLLDEKKFYVPEILRLYYPHLVDEWLEDISSVSEYPQGMLFNVNETGKYENFVMKTYQRLCTAPQLEVMHITRDTLQKYLKSLKERIDNNKVSVSDKYIYQKLLAYSYGARCTFPHFDCPEKCGFKEGINLTRHI